MVPSIVHGITGSASVNPLLFEVVPNIPFVPTQDVALVAPNQTQPIKIHADVELQNLRDPEVRGIEVEVIGEVMQRRKEGVT